MANLRNILVHVPCTCEVWMVTCWKHIHIWSNYIVRSMTYLLTYLLIYLLHGAGYYLKSWLSLRSSKNIPLSYGTRRFITVFTKARHWTLSWASRIQFAPSIPISLNVIQNHLHIFDINTAVPAYSAFIRKQKRRNGWNAAICLKDSPYIYIRQTQVQQESCSISGS
jgi:hypothetical protein